MFWVVAVAAAILYGLMEAGRYWGGVQIGPVPTARWLLFAMLETYRWSPSFLGGLVLRRRAVSLAVITVLVGGLLAKGFRGYFAPTLVIDDWSPGTLKLAETVLAILGAAVSAMGGQFLAQRSSDKPLQPTAREDARSG